VSCMLGVSEGRTTAVSPRRAHTRERLITAAMHVFAERGVNGASVEEICEAAGFTRGAFYSNFPDKSALVLAIIQQNIARQVVAAERAIAVIKLASNVSADELVSLALTAYEEAGREPGESTLADRELLLHAARKPELRRPYLEFLEQSERQIAGLIQDALQHVGLEFTIPVEHAIRLLGAAHEQSKLLAIFGQRPADQALIRSLLVSITRPL
jgi:AcrR family transcriptional regulator